MPLLPMKKPIAVGDNIDGREILAVEKLPHPSDHYLRLVFAKYEDQYVSWLYNADFGGFSYGRYATTEEEGKERFTEHCAYYKIK